MKKLFAAVIIAIVSFGLISGTAFARVVVLPGPKHKTVIVKQGPRPVIVKKGPQHGVVVVKKVWYPERTVVIAGKPFHYRPWRFIGRVVIIAPAVIYAHPHPGSAVILNAGTGSEYQAVEEFNGWYHIKGDRKDGWVQKDKVDVIEVKEEVETEGVK